MSVSGDINIGLPNLATINNSFSSLYKPIVVAYGANDALVAKPYNELLTSNSDGL